jgi:catechol 2,3-dioxygenase-like lactoylglutathione lyase family enzyme
MPDLAYRPSHLGICVSDLEKSMRFYCDGLGFQAADRFELTSGVLPDLGPALEVDGDFTVVSQMVVKGPLKVELLHYPARAAEGRPSTSRGSLGLTHLSFSVDGLDEAAGRLVEHGGTLLASTRGNLGIAVVFVADPDGTRVELMGR